MMTRSSAPELALGTAQFGLAYGVAGRGAVVPEADVRDILEHAASLGVRRLDTAAAYGSIEERLAGLAQGLAFDVVSKLPALPDGLTADDASTFVERALERSRTRLGELLCGMLFHRADDLTGPHGAVIWDVAARWGERNRIAIGVSCYDPSTLAGLRRTLPLQMAQLPGNAWDQRLLPQSRELAGVEISIRSLFLQGLLLMPPAAAVRRLPAAAPSVARWHDWCRDRGTDPLHAALAAAKGLPGVSYCVVGVDSVRQLEEIVDAWGNVDPRLDAAVASDDVRIIDPRNWDLRP